MRRLSLFLFVAMGLCAVVAGAIDLQGMKPSHVIPSGTNIARLDSATAANGLVGAYTFYSYDASDDFYITVYRSGVADDNPIYVPAGKSLLIPAPTPQLNSATGFYHHKFVIAGHADTVQAIPWVR